jgi:osmoprotectant transport system ATP-binding protein
VTHDIEEAVRLGDRTAVLRQGGFLEQYATPATILGAPATRFVAEFVGADRGLKRLSVTRTTEHDLDHPPVVSASDSFAEASRVLRDAGSRWAVVLDDHGGLAGWIGRDLLDGDGVVRSRAERMEAWVQLGDSLKIAFGEMLQWDAGWIAVLDPDDQHYLGVLTPNTLHTALRRSVDADRQGVEPSEVSVDTVANA